MKAEVNKTALLALQWSVGVVIFIEAALLAFSHAEIRFPGHGGIHHWIRLGLAWTEMLACILFLVPRAMKLGSQLLITVFAVAVFLHVLQGNFQIGGLLIYAAAVSVVASQARPVASSEHQR
jgi:uncharacterized membrane protein YphA (DoxX/SURF4 family)